jgi:hypothetical protein
MANFYKAPVYYSRYFREYGEAYTWAQEELNKVLNVEEKFLPITHAASVLRDAGTYKATVEATWTER